MKSFIALIAVCVLVGAGNITSAQDQTNTDKFVSRDDYLKLKADHDKLKEELDALKGQMQEFLKRPAAPETETLKTQLQDLQKKDAARQTETDQALDDLEKKLKDVKAMAKDSYPGSTKMLLAGYGTAGFVSQDHGGSTLFNATFNPIFLWKISDRLLFEGELEAELEGHDTSLALEMAHLSYLLNDYVTVSAGKFLNPMNYFVERQHMGWVNKLPDKPLAVYDGLLSEANVGFQVRGGVPVGSMKLGYALFAANAPELQVDPNSVAATDLGTFAFDNFDNIGNHVAIGGRAGFYPIPELELGYGFQFADVSPPGSSGVNAWFQSADLSYVRDSVRLKGILNFKAQWVWSHVDRFIYDPSGTIGGPFLFNNNRDGGYVQIAYRPSRVENLFLKNVEAVFRYDMLNQADTPTGVDETRYTIGLNYWLGQSTVFKTAYEFDRQSGDNADRHNAFLMQFVAGF